jgi:hypothetical protein
MQNAGRSLSHTLTLALSQRCALLAYLNRARAPRISHAACCMHNAGRNCPHTHTLTLALNRSDARVGTLLSGRRRYSGSGRERKAPRRALPAYLDLASAPAFRMRRVACRMPPPVLACDTGVPRPAPRACTRRFLKRAVRATRTRAEKAPRRVFLAGLNLRNARGNASHRTSKYCAQRA